jgi:hypothetical protein
MARDINVNAHPYPSNFSSLSQEERNAYFTKAACDYDARKAKARAPEEPPLRNSDLGEGEALWESGCPVDTLRRALNGRETGPLGFALALIDEAPPR